MKPLTAVLIAAALVAPTSSAQSRAARHVFSVDAPSIGSAGGGEASLSGGGTYDPASGFQQGGGGFHVTRDIDQGPLAGLKAGEGVRWASVQILPSTAFKCGSADEPPKTVVTDGDTVVLQAIFFREGDGTSPSFTAKIFVSAVDEDPDAPGIQNVWIQGVGCAEANVNVH